MEENIVRDTPETDYPLEQIRFGDKVITPNGDEGTVTELNGEQYRVYNNVEVGWFKREELTLIK